MRRAGGVSGIKPPTGDARHLAPQIDRLNLQAAGPAGGHQVLNIPEGPARGQHTLVREREAAQSHTAWVIGVVILGIVVLAAALVLFRSRKRQAAEQ